MCAFGRQFGVKRGRISFALMGTTALLLIMASHTPLWAQSAQKSQQAQALVKFAISAQPLSSAIVAFSRASGINVVSGGVIAASTKTSGVNGTMTPSEGLSALLAGTGYSYHFTGKASVTLSNGADAGATVPGAIPLDTIDVSGGSREGAADLPYQTPGSSSYISEEQINRVTPASPGDMFKSTPGVIAAGNRTNNTLNINIRGLQGMGRVNTMVDGTQQATSTYRGYGGHDSRTSVDPELISGITIDKGPNSGPYGAGAMGGTVNLQTLTADDIVRDGKSFGSRIRGELASNTDGVPALGTTDKDFDRPSFLTGDNASGSAAVASKSEKFDWVAAYSFHDVGNYFAGTRGKTEGLTRTGLDHWEMAPLSPYGRGQEIYNTSQDTRSALVKGKWKPTPDQSLELGYTRYESDYGEGYEDNLYFTIIPQSQEALSTTTTDTYTIKYHWDPKDNDLVDLHVNAWKVNADTDVQQAYARTLDTYGGEAWNTSKFSFASMKLNLEYGGQFFREEQISEKLHAYASYGYPDIVTSPDPDGVRSMESAYTRANLDLTSWLRLDGGLRYEHYHLEAMRASGEHVPTQDDDRINPSAGVVISPVEGVQLFATYASGWRPPSIREMAYQIYQPLFGVVNVLPNPDLRPETSQNFEYGVNLMRDGLAVDGDKARMKFVYFDNTYEDYIVRMEGYGAFGLPYIPARYTFGNIDQANYRGLEISGSYDSGKFFAEGAFTYYTDITYCYPGQPCADMTGASDYSAGYVPPEYTASFTLGARLFDEALTLGFRGTYAGERAIGASGTGTTPPVVTNPYGIYDAFASYDVNENLTLGASVENITDQYYLDALANAKFPSPGRTVRANFTARF